jgi:hypothetical protein
LIARLSGTLKERLQFIPNSLKKNVGFIFGWGSKKPLGRTGTVTIFFSVSTHTPLVVIATKEWLLVQKVLMANIIVA